VMIELSADLCAHSYALPGGWSMISLPCQVTDASLSALFPTAISLFSFDNGYRSETTLEPARGYWINIPAPTTADISGAKHASTELVVDLPSAWSMVGSGDVSVDVASLGSNVISVFGFDAGYQAASAMAPGDGYWINLTNAGQIDLNGGGTAAKSVLPATTDLASYASRGMLWIDAVDGGQAISLGGGLETAVELPPVPPAGMFDARVLLNGIGTMLVPDGADEAVYPLLLQGEVEQLRWQVPADQAGRWELLVDGATVEMVGSGALYVDASQELSVRRIAPLPAEFALGANYPNPFNPSTTIGYSLTMAGTVELRVYACTGQLVRRLVAGEQPAGKHTVQWDGADAQGHAMANGVYLYELRAGAFRSVRRMVLIK
jgi:flagellar hook capping protein FlgD